MAIELTDDMRAIISTGVHPFILKITGSVSAARALSMRKYDASLMAAHLPAPSDARGILEFFGLDSAAVERVLQAAGPDVQSLPDKVQDPGNGPWRFPLSNALEQAYQNSAPPAQRPVPETYDGYFACAMQQGLRPEFACTVGLHPSDPRYASTHETFYQVVDPENASRDRVVSNKYLLDGLWRDQIRQETGVSVTRARPQWSS